MGLTDFLIKKKFDGKNYKKYVKDANTAFGFLTSVDSLGGDIFSAPKYVRNVYFSSLFIADALNSSIALFFFNDTYKYADYIEEALKESGLEDVADIYSLAKTTMSNITIDHEGFYNDYLDSFLPNVTYNLNLYEEEIAKLHGEDCELYNRLDKYIKSELQKDI